MKQRPDPLRVLAVCGLGMGTSLILRMTTETVCEQMGINAEVSNTDVSSARGEAADVVVGQGMHIDEVADIAPIAVVVDDFVDEQALRTRLEEALRHHGWL